MIETGVPEPSAAVEASTVPVSSAAVVAVLDAIEALGRGREPAERGIPPLPQEPRRGIDFATGDGHAMASVFPSEAKYGAGNGIRTRDPQLGKG